MGISRDSRHKRRATGGKRPQNVKKRNYNMGRPAALTKLGAKRIHLVRTRGGNQKYRALRLEAGNFSWASEAITRKTRLIDVIYNASSNELVRTKTLVKACIVQIDATPFRQWYEAHYGTALARKSAVVGKADAKEKKGKSTKAADAAKAAKAPKAAKAEEAAAPEAAAAAADDKKKSKHLLRKLAARKKTSKLDQALTDQFSTGRLYAAVSSRPGQSGRCDGYILEGQELAFYLKKLKAKRGA